MTVKIGRAVHREIFLLSGQNGFCSQPPFSLALPRAPHSESSEACAYHKRRWRFRGVESARPDSAAFKAHLFVRPLVGGGSTVRANMTARCALAQGWAERAAPRREEDGPRPCRRDQR